MAAQVEKRNLANGLMTAVNPLSAPEGALVEAMNVVINEPHTVEPRRGFDDYYGRYDGISRYYGHVTNLSDFHSRGIVDRDEILYWALTKGSSFALLHNYRQDGILMPNGVNDWYDALSVTQSAGYTTLPLVRYSSVDAFAPPSIQRFRDLTLLTTADGVKRTTAYKFDTDFAGLPAPQNLTVAISRTGTEAVKWFPSSNKTVSTVAFRSVFSRTTTAQQVVDVDRLVISAPSPRYVLVSEILPDITSVTVTTDKPRFVFSAPHGLAVGDQFSIVDGPADASWKRTYVVETVTTNQIVVCQAAPGLTTTNMPTTTTEWVRYSTASLRLSRRGFNQQTMKYLLYRTNITTVSTSIGATDPGDEMLQIEFTPGNFIVDTNNNELLGNITGYDVELGSLLYTNPSQQTISKANDRPPISTVMATFANSVFYANTRQYPKTEFRLESISGLAQGTTVMVTLTDSDTGTTATENFVAGTTESAANKTFLYSTTGTPSQNTERTIRSLVRVINAASTNLLAQYTSDFNDLPGRFVITTDNVKWDTIRIDSTAPNSFDPRMPSDFQAERRPNRLFYSKIQQPDHVPSLNYVDAGDLTAEITNLVPANDRLLIVTTAGIYQLSGYGESSFAIQPVDLTVRITAPRTVVSLEGQTFALTQAGFSRIDGGDVTPISTSIDDEVVRRVRWSNTFENAHAVADPVRRELLLWLPLAENSDRTVGFRFSAATGAWTRLDREALAAGFLAKKGDLVLALSTPDLERHKLVTQRTSGSSTDDFRDERIATTILARVADTVTLRHTDLFQPTPLPGWMLEQSGERAVVRSVHKLTTGEYVVTLDKTVRWVNGVAFLYPGIRSRVTPVAFVAGNSAIWKQFGEVSVVLRDNTAGQITLGLTTDQTRSEHPLVVDNPSLSHGWGKSPWGKSPWGAPRSQEIDLALRTFIPGTCNYARSLRVSFNHDRAGEKYQLIEMSVALTPNTERTVR